MTLRWANIQGVYTLLDTSQLIPFIVGVVSTGLTVNDIVLHLVRRVRTLSLSLSLYSSPCRPLRPMTNSLSAQLDPNWAKTRLVVTNTYNGSIIPDQTFRIERVPDGESTNGDASHRNVSVHDAADEIELASQPGARTA